jgi:hypothetical protein
MGTNKFLSAALSILTMALCAQTVACTSDVQDDESVDQANEDLSQTAQLRFDVATQLDATAMSNDGDTTHCASIVPADDKGHRKCLRGAELEALNYKNARGHFVAMPTDSHRAQIHANGNALAGYINALNDDFGKKSGHDAAVDALAAMKVAYNGKLPQYVIVNEISAGTWPANAEYRQYVVDFASTLAEAGKTPIVAAPFDAPKSNADSWSALAKVGYVAAEIQITGPEVVADAGYAQRTLENSVSAYGHLGVAKSRLMFLDNYSNSTPGTEWGRSGVSLDDWKKVIVARTNAAAAVRFAGYVSYAWEGNTGESSSATRIGLEKLYASQNVL